MSPEPHPHGRSVHTPQPEIQPEIQSAIQPQIQPPAATASQVPDPAILSKADKRCVLERLGPPLDSDNNLRPGWTAKMVWEYGWVIFVVHALAIWTGFAPSKKEFKRVVPSDYSYRKYFGRYSVLVQGRGYKNALERRRFVGAQRRNAIWEAERAERAARDLAKRKKISPGTPTALAVQDPAVQKTDQPSQKSRRSPELVYGDRLHGCGMAHAPVNEQGVVLLFGMLAKELKFEIEMVRTAYPDCEAKRQGKDGKWRKVLIEFEFATSRFDHDPQGCDLIVCWVDDRNTTGLEVLELRKCVAQLSAPQRLKASKRTAQRSSS